MAITQITLNLGGDDKDLKVDYVSDLIQQAFDQAERDGNKTPTITIGQFVLDIDPSSYRVQRLGKETP